MEPRPVCHRCRRPESMCVCGELRPAESRTRVVFLQHPREARVPVSTCRLAHLSLPNSEMHVAMRPEGSPELEAVVRTPGTMLLFPGPTAIDIGQLDAPPPHLVVVDGTWINARKVVDRSPLLAALPRLGFSPPRPSNYRIRREPAAHCVSTIEAVAYVLDELERAPGRFTPMLGAFTRLVDLQLTHRDGPRTRRAAPPSVVDRVRGLSEHLVLLFAEACEHDGDEALHWMAVRHATGERFESLLRPRWPLAGRARWSPRSALPAEPLEAAAARWHMFVRPDDVIAAWGLHPVDVLERQGVPIPDPLDLKRLVCNRMQARAGGVEHLAERLGATLPEGDGRPPRILAALGAVVRALEAGGLRPGT